MPADLPAADKPTAKPKSAPAPSALEMAAASTDPLVQKLMFDRGVRLAEGDPHVSVIDAELRKLGFDV